MRGSVDFLVRPLGALYFGPPRRFDAGVDHHGVTFFPPPQSAFQGMIRSQLLREAGVDLLREKEKIAQLVGEPSRLPDGWQIRGPLPARVVDDDGNERLEPWVPAPAFLYKEERPDQPSLKPASIFESGLPAVQASVPGVALGLPRVPKARPAGGWLSAQGLKEVLSGRSLDSDQVAKHWRTELPPFVEYEDQPGLALEPTRHGVARHGMLYFLRKVRFRQVSGGLISGFWGGLHISHGTQGLPDLPLNGTLGAAGRKSLPVAFEKAPKPVKAWRSLEAGDHLPPEVGEDERFWLMICTPVALRAPREPLAIGRLPPEVRIEVDAVLTDKPTVEGGMSYTTQGMQIRPTRHLLPAGTTWLFRLVGGDGELRAQALRRIHACHPLGEPEDAAFGYGYSLIGVLPNK